MFYIVIMSFIPQDTRNQYKAQHRDSFNFPQSLPAVSAEPVQTQIPVFDRNMFMNPTTFNGPPRNVQNDRLMQTSQIYRDFGEKQHEHYLQPTNPYYQQQAVTQYDNRVTQTREKREEKRYLDENRNMERAFMTTRNYNAELGDRVNGFGIVAKDTRFESTKKSSDLQVEMRSNRYLGLPGNNL